MGLQLSGNVHHQESLFGDRPYDGDQRSFYANYIYKTIITDTRHQIKMGASWQWDSYEEVFEDRVWSAWNLCLAYLANTPGKASRTLLLWQACGRITTISLEHL